MPTDKVEAESGEARTRKHQRLRLIESYGAFSDDRLREVTEKIRDVTASQTSPSVPSNIQADEPLGDPSGEPNDGSSPGPLGTPIRPSIDIPIHPPDRSPNETPIQKSHESSPESFIEAPQRAPNRDDSDHPVLLTENQAILYFCLQRIG